jgi:hypothetical protein
MTIFLSACNVAIVAFGAAETKSDALGIGSPTAISIGMTALSRAIFDIDLAKNYQAR